jgi:hypothetical protein
MRVYDFISTRIVWQLPSTPELTIKAVYMAVITGTEVELVQGDY